MSNLDPRTGKPKIILHLFADKGTDSFFYSQNYYDVRLITKEIGIENYHAPENVYGIIANPVCTMLSRARSNAKIPRDLKQGIFFVDEVQRILRECLFRVSGINHPRRPVKFWMIENPGTGYLPWFLGKPVFSYHPYEYGENYSKETALWGYFNLPMRPTLFNQIEKKNSVNYRHGIKKKDRSNCPVNFAMAFYEANQ